jgi:UDP-glucose 4-epimerase
MRLLLTGGFGYLAGRIADTLADAHTVVLSSRGVPAAARPWASKFEVRHCDVLEPASHAAALEGIDAVIHLASLDEREAEADPYRAIAVSAEGTRLLLAAARAASVQRFVFFSTFHVYGPTAPAVVDEEVPTRASHPYAIAHLAGEGFCRQARERGQDVLIVRPSNGYGAPNWLEVDRWTLAHNDFCRQAVRTGRIVLRSSGMQHRDFVGASDIAAATQLLVEAPREALGDGVFNVGGRLSLAVYDVARKVQAQARELLKIDCPINRPEPAASDSCPSVDFRVDRMAKLGYQPRDWFDVETQRLFALLGQSK